MAKFLFIIGFLWHVAAAPANASPSPLKFTGLDWNKAFEEVPVLAGYKYWYGDVSWGTIIYLGLEDVLNTENELHLNFVGSKKLFSALLILGPSGMTRHDCLRKYNDVISLLSKKYGPYKRKHIKEDPIHQDLVFNTTCNAIAIGAYEVDTAWQVGKFHINATILGDEDGFYIEIEYTRLDLIRLHEKERIQKILKKL